MKTEPIETIGYKSININIYQDDITDSPDDWEDTNVFLVNYHRDFTIERDEIITEADLVKLYADKEKIEQEKQFFILPLSMLSHSGVTLSLASQFITDSGGWDTSHVGAILVSRKEAKTRQQAEKLAAGLIETWNDYLSGSVYGYMLEYTDTDGQAQETGGCWGFYGDYNKSGLLQAAKDEADGLIDELAKTKQEEAKKAQEPRLKSLTLGEMLKSKDETIKRHAYGILKHLITL